MLLFVFYRHSVLGRQILAAGANARAAKMSGVPVDRVITISHALSGLLAATAGMMVVARLGAAMPAVGGEDWLLPSFLGPVLGGTPLSGGAVAVVGTMLGALLVTTIRSGLLVLQIGNFWLQLYLGVILLLAVLADRYRALLSGASRNPNAMSCSAAFFSSSGPASRSPSSWARSALSVIAPNFLTEFNLYVMLRSLSVGLLVAFAQMVTLGVGQMNIAVGALGGLTAIIFGATMELYGFPLLSGGSRRARDRRARRPDQRPPDRAHRRQRLHHHARDRIRVHWNQFRHNRVDPVLQNARCPGRLRRPASGGHALPARCAADRRLAARRVLLPRPAGARAPCLWRQSAGRRIVSGISRERVVVSAHVLSGLLAAAAAVLAVAQLGSAQPTIGADWLLLSFAAPIIGGAALTGGHISVLGTMFAVLLLGLIQNGMVLAKVDPYWVQFVLGALILAAVGLNRWRAVNSGVGLTWSLALESVSKSFPGVQGARRRFARPEGGRNPCPDGRKRRRQIDADQDRHRPHSSRFRPRPPERPPGRSSARRAMR